MPLDGQKMSKKEPVATEDIFWVVAGSLSGEKY